MKRIFFSLMIFQSALVFSQTNLVTNGGFESWTNSTKPQNWSTTNTVLQNTSDFSEGANSCKLSNSATSSPEISTSVLLTSGTKYTVKFKYKYLDSNYSGSNPISMHLIKSGVSSYMSSSNFASNNNWNVISSSFTPSATTSFDFSISIYSFENQIFNVLIDNVQIYDASATSVEDVRLNNEVTFKNPVQNELVINSQAEISTIELFSLDGELIKKSNTNYIDTSNLPNGIYLVNVKFMNGYNLSKKVVKN